ncbi:hypothetical protein [Dendronalium sp. ChiSLP03b]|uniref:hypothetical protein n=1 Tax=Dendronalium sp. ChiSLP03b TaxID=3075381 RepID=UPI002AD448C3|nr:hypothetical protein [Dendronalium sp. ChiSLP03b]MDZ8203104.1 hypothetical protein [Dendronalium sp. ChiSLP03b]
MSKKSVPTTRTQHKATLGEQIRSIADRLKQETDVQIKATSRILGAAAQISENHERLINEVVDMVEEDLDQQTHKSQKDIYTIDILKRDFKTFSEAKVHFNLKANSWESLVNKLNEPSFQKSISKNEIQSEHDIKSINIKKVEQRQKNIKRITVHLESDVAEMFPNSEAVNEALRFLIRITKSKALINKN